MHIEQGLWRAVRWPLLVLGVAVLGIAAAMVLDQTPAREYALVVGGPALAVLLPLGLLWLVVAAAVHVLRQRRGASTP